MSGELRDSVSESALAQPDLARALARLRRREPRSRIVRSGTGQAAVTAVLRVERSVPELLFIRRAELDGDPWSGHMALPGGRLDPDDSSLRAAAIREVREELDLDLGLGAVLGRLDDLEPVSRRLPPVVIRPFVAVVPADVQIRPNREVAETYWVSIAELRSPAIRSDKVLTVDGERLRFPGYRVGGQIVWGLTERIVSQLLPLFDP